MENGRNGLNGFSACGGIFHHEDTKAQRHKDIKRYNVVPLRLSVFVVKKLGYNSHRRWMGAKYLQIKKALPKAKAKIRLNPFNPFRPFSIMPLMVEFK